MFKICNTATTKCYEIDITATWTSLGEVCALFIWKSVKFLHLIVLDLALKNLLWKQTVSLKVLLKYGIVKEIVIYFILL